MVAIALLFALSPTSASAAHPDPEAIVVDGKAQDPVTGVVEAAYVINGITYTQDQATGEFAGLLYSAHDDDNLYFAFAQSPFINDNPYGATGIGWDDRKQNHKLADLIKSEHAKIQLYDAAGNLIYDFFIDYAESADGDKGRTVTGITNPGVLGPDGAFTVGPDPADVTSATSLFWNFNENQAPFEFVDSPQRIPTNTYDSGTTANPANVWIYETVYEWSVPKTAFAADGGYDSIVISEVHNSPFKTGNPVPIPVLTVSKTSDPISGSDVVGGQTILYTVTVSNPGTVAVTNVVITDAIDSNLTNINPLDGETFDGSVVTWPTIPVFGAGATVSVQFEADVKFGLDIAPPTAIFNTRTISSPDLSTDVQTNTTVHFVIGNPSIGLTKQVDQDLFSTPGPATYTYTVTNTGDVTLHNVSVSDDQEGPITLAPGAITGGTDVHNVTQAEIDAGDDIVNIAVATSDEATSGPASETVSVVQNPLVGVTKTAVVSALTRTVTNTVNEGTGEGASNSATQISTSLVVAQNIVYTKTVKNDGNTTLTNVTLVDTLPSDITITANPDGGDVSTLGEISWDHGSIAVGGSANRPNRV